jgi:hypothetical protein
VNEMNEIEMRGIDGGNLLGFLAALGTLRLLTKAETRYGRLPLMNWKWRGKWSPVLHTSATADGVLAGLALALVPDNGDVPVKVKGKKAAQDSNAILFKANRAFQSDVLDLNLAEFRNTLGCAALNSDREEADFLSALGSDCYPERKGENKPATTEFRAIGGGNNDGFLGLMRAIHSETKPEHLRSALFEDWSYSDPPPFMRWDPNEFRPHALRGKDPAKDRKQNNVRGANRLAIDALPLFPTFPERREVRTAGFEDRNQVTEFTWPIWSELLDLDTIRALLWSKEVQVSDRETMRRRGVVQVFRAKRFTEGQYRNFSPARALL